MYFNLRDNVVYCEECKDIGSVKVDLREVMEFNEILDKTFDEIVREKYINSFDNLNLIGRMIERIEQEV